MNAVPLVVLTPSGYISGSCNLPLNRSLRAFLSSDDELIKLTGVVLPGTKKPIPFFAIQKSAIILVVPNGERCAEEDASGLVRAKSQSVSCLLAHGSIHGEFLLPDVIRFSDYLTLKKGFIELRQCHIGSSSFLYPEDVDGVAIPLVLINTQNLVGITDQVAEKAPVV